ncbi:hypothetical protein SPRG_13291 [Saprolegnia parasitica CBS 223.65]|uniref:Uncharacterized protein n=1 Tax=Saprolegnia parasitica (strain CBS 223.65) TaxID=695850 RepID=A0A067C490_SAPPC|nr:hypothetical protein SPRG_13291 [Saprolegnia parasitica CBS 223.65]KDO21607.1 hypothetical protein SPRG_13291 [Saprolegnia parasitica CBS 223.65]|eukprot:XP_012207693.1 hypothetical protein SPRG_13291 [Saprolegnia parasitica CBS 223.65]
MVSSPSTPFHLQTLTVAGFFVSASGAPCTLAQNSSLHEAMAVNTSAACASAINATTATPFYTTLYRDNYYGVCQPSCAADLANYTSSVPDCDEYMNVRATASVLNNYCTNMSSPTMNGGVCTEADTLLVGLATSAPVWANCSNIIPAATLSMLSPTTPAQYQTYCGTPTCVANTQAVAHRLPNCTFDPKYPTANVRASHEQRFSCSPAPIGAPCTLADANAMNVLGNTPLWVNCSSAIGLPSSTTINSFVAYVMAKLSTNTPQTRAFCRSPCVGIALALGSMAPVCSLTTMPYAVLVANEKLITLDIAIQSLERTLGAVASAAAMRNMLCPATPAPTTPRVNPTPTSTPTPTPTPLPTKSMAPTKRMVAIGTVLLVSLVAMLAD